MKKPKIVFSDFDGTLTKQGRLSPVFFDVLELLRLNRIPLVIVTGRPLSWSHFLMTHLPIEACITEGGGMLTIRSGDRFKDVCLASDEQVIHLQRVTKRLLSEVTNLTLSDDSIGRITDRAIELEELEDFERKKQIIQILQEEKINFSQSNVHLNFWSGEISKAGAMDYYLSNQDKVSKDEVIFFGDSYNDESVFEHYPHCVGVANIAHCLKDLKFKPEIILQGEGNKGINGVRNYLKSIL